MGQEIGTATFADGDYEQFSRALRSDLAALGVVLARPGFGAGESTIGIELELNLIDAAGQPLLRNQEVLAATHDPRVKLEIARFNLEVNGSPLPLRGRPFTTVSHEIGELLSKLRPLAAEHGGRIAMIGILPTLRSEHMQVEALTDTARYRALSAGLKRLRQGPLRLHIRGEDALDLDGDSPAFEGANTSLQVHLRVAPDDFADAYNAAQLAAAPVLACAGNSPLFLGRRLWAETRIALFRQSSEDRCIDECTGESGPEWRPARVSFGHGWVRRGAHELFAESVAQHAPILPVCNGEPDPLAAARAGRTPELCCLRLHHGTTWRWNRAVFDPVAGGHLRIELRALPAGPTVVDMAANAAFALGLTLGLQPHAESLVSALTFGQARRNFYAAARHGLDAELLWPCEETPSPQPVRASALIPQLLPLARKGLLDAKVEADEADTLLGVIRERVLREQTGASWQLRTLAALEQRLIRSEALSVLLDRYLAYADTAAPVHLWPVHGL